MNSACIFPSNWSTPCLVLTAALSTSALAQEGAALPPVTVQSTRASATLPLRETVQAEREKLAQVPGGTNLAEPQKEARLATLRDALDYQPGIVLQDIFWRHRPAAPEHARLGHPE